MSHARKHPLSSVSSTPEHTLELFGDIGSVRDVVRGVLHTIFFHRHFPLVRPTTLDVLDLTLPYLPIPELEAQIDKTAYQLSRQLAASTSPSSVSSGTTGGNGRASIQIQFLEKRRKPATSSRAQGSVSPSAGTGGGGGGLGWLGGMVGAAARGAMAGATGGGGTSGGGIRDEEEVCWETWVVKVTLATPRTESERIKAMRAMETTLQRTIFKVMAIANGQKEHIPPITTEQAFPYTILLNPRVETWGMR